MALFADAALGQSLSIVRTGQTELWINTAAPPDTQYILQASRNLHLRVDLNDGVSDQVSNRVDKAGVTERFFRLMPSTPPAPPITIVLLGDSTVADFASNANLVYGWGSGIYGYFKENARVVNLAYPGYSSKSFLASDEKTRMMTIKPNFVLVEFGLIDEFATADAYRTTLEEFAADLKTIVQMVRGFDGTPILVTRRLKSLQPEGNVVPVYQDRMAVVRNVAAELQTPLIDLNKLSIDMFNILGKSESEYIWWPGKDYLHFSEKGAQVIAGLVVNALPASLGTYLVPGILDPPPKP
jgi:lysophospholipase L1-like esterase